MGLLGRQSIAILALTVAVSGGTAYAASAMWTGANIVDSSLTGADIQNGSITSADLATGTGSGGGAAALATVNLAGPVTIAASDAAAGTVPTVASQAFTTTSAGFVDIRYAATLAASSQDVCGVGAYFFTNLYVRLDGGANIQGVYLDAGPATSMPNRNIGSAWLPAGNHTLEIVSADTYCDTPSGTFLATEIHASVTPSA